MAIEQRTRFSSTHLADYDAVGPVTKDCLQKFIKADLAAMGICLGFGGDDMRFADRELGGVFDGEDAVVIWDRIGQYIEQGRLTRARTSGDQEVLAVAHGSRQCGCLICSQHLSVNEISESEVPRRKLADLAADDDGGLCQGSHG